MLVKYSLYLYIANKCNTSVNNCICADLSRCYQLSHLHRHVYICICITFADVYMAACGYGVWDASDLPVSGIYLANF